MSSLTRFCYPFNGINYFRSNDFRVIIEKKNFFYPKQILFSVRRAAAEPKKIFFLRRVKAIPFIRKINLRLDFNSLYI